MATQNQIESFYEFASGRVSNGGADLSMEQLFDLWAVNFPSQEELSQSVAAIESAIRDMESGDRGQKVEDVLSELRRKASHSAKG